jgi:hypothetical protein
METERGPGMTKRNIPVWTWRIVAVKGFSGRGRIVAKE